MRLFTVLLLATLLCTCVDPVVPQFEYDTGLYLVEGQIENRIGRSEITISKSEIVFGAYTLSPVFGATVTSIQTDGPEVAWQQLPGTNIYRPDLSFAGEIGEEYVIRIVTPDNETIESLPERVPPAVPIGPTRVVFDQESYFNDNLDRFVPAFTVLLDLDDPVGIGNVFQFRYQAWTSLDVCETCFDGLYRNGRCQPANGANFSYRCDEPCWAITTGNTINLVSDAFGDGRKLEDIVAARIDRVGTGFQLVELEQSAITGAAYDYARIKESLIEGSGGLNAPLPAALYGNLSMVSGGNVTVLGFVGAAAVDSKRFAFNRDTFPGEALFPPRMPVFEDVIPPITAPCDGPNRTRIKPFGWPG